MIITNFTNNVKKCFFWPYLLHFSDLKKKCNGNLNHFQQLLFHTFPPPINFIFLFIVLMPRILKVEVSFSWKKKQIGSKGKISTFYVNIGKMSEFLMDTLTKISQFFAYFSVSGHSAFFSLKRKKVDCGQRVDPYPPPPPP